MKQHLCPQCGGKGYHWKRGHIISRRDASIIADINERGANCDDCGGSGIYYRLTAGEWVLVGFAGLLASIFVIQPLIRLWLD
jgi:hypothetical protein